MCHIFSLRADIENPPYFFEDMYQKIVLAEFHENQTLPGGFETFFRSGGQQKLKMHQLPPVVLDFHNILQGQSVSGYLQTLKIST